MKSRSKKIEELKAIKDKLPRSKMVVFTTFSRAHSTDSTSLLQIGSGQAGDKGLSVAQMTELKRLLRSIGSEYFVTKKTLIDLALKGLNYDSADVYKMEGSIGLVFGNNDPYAIAKKLYEFSKKNQALKFFGAIFENGFISTEKFLEIAKTPSRETLITKLLGTMKYPIFSLRIILEEIGKSKEAS